MNSLPRIELRTADGASASLFHHGAHLTSWKTPDDRERLFVSSTSEYGPGTAIRGGVPVVFPQFSGLGPLKKHGFARNLVWTPVKVQPDAVTMRLTDSAETLAQWPHRFVLDLEFRLQAWTLEMTLRVQNTGDTAFDFTTALHGYFAVEDSLKAQVFGLHGLRYRNNPTQTEHDESAETVRFGNEIDRTYFAATDREVTLHDGPRRLRFTQRGFTDTVVWNPAAEVAAKIPDLEPGGWLRYVCVESASVRPVVTLATGETWSGTQRVEVQL